MATTAADNALPTIFNEIIRKRVTNYIDNEMKLLIREKMDSIISSVMSDLQGDADFYRDMAKYETGIVVRAIYNGVEIAQKVKE